MFKQKEIEEVLNKLALAEINYLAVGGFAKFLLGKTNDFSDIDFFIPEEFNKNEKIEYLIKLFNSKATVNKYKFDKIIRIRYKNLKIDFLPKLDGINSFEAFEKAGLSSVYSLPIKTLSFEDIVKNIETVQKQII